MKKQSLNQIIDIKDILYIGKRGSHCIGLQDKNSDLDLTIIVKSNGKYKNFCFNQDIHVIDYLTFKKGLSKIAFETVEFMFNEVYIKDEFKEEMEYYRDLLKSKNEDVEYLFWYQIFSMLKNQIKQFEKEERIHKFGSKTVLLWSLFQEKDCLKYWTKEKEISKEIKDLYFKNKYKELDLNLIQQAKSFRYDDTNRVRFHLGQIECIEKIKNLLEYKGVEYGFDFN